jgi:hypothetical protein
MYLIYSPPICRTTLQLASDGSDCPLISNIGSRHGYNKAVRVVWGQSEGEGVRNKHWGRQSEVTNIVTVLSMYIPCRTSQDTLLNT